MNKLDEIYNCDSIRPERWTADGRAVEHDLGLPVGTVSEVRIEKYPRSEPVITFKVRMKLKTYEKWSEKYCGLLNAYKYRKVKK